MKNFKNERDWSDFERADKIVMAVMFVVWLGCSFGVFKQTSPLKQQKEKIEMVKQVVTIKAQVVRPQR